LPLPLLISVIFHLYTIIMIERVVICTGDLFDAELVMHSKEAKPKLKLFVNLDTNKLGIEIDRELGSLRFFIYKKKKKHQLMKGQWIGIHQDVMPIYKTLEALILRYYKMMDRLEPNGSLPMYTQIELRKLVSHLHFHANAGTLEKLLSKEIIYN